ncbi:MAG: hypothetical protein SFU85_00460 [Candidatus Methylacidiphilales bacterium]|nr:hypothetical protein [Candidatus Methylacidiphilales bacterium]
MDRRAQPMIKAPVPILALLLSTGSLFSAEVGGYIAGRDWEERGQGLARWLSENDPAHPDFPKEAMPHYAARLQTGIRAEEALVSMGRMIEATLRAKPDPFNLHAVMHGYCLNREKIPSDLAGRFRAFAATWDYTKSIGVSLNYMLMRDGGGWIAAQEWPDLVDRAGNPAPRIREMCKLRLMKLMEDTVKGNASEYGAPLYLGTDMMALRLLAEYARDAELQRAAQMTLEWMLIHTGAHWHQGYYTTAAARAKYWGSVKTSPDSAGATTGMAYLFFGGERPARLGGVSCTYWLAHPGRVFPAPWLSSWQAALPPRRTVQSAFVSPDGKDRAYAMAWVTPGYAVASETSDNIPADSYHYKELRRTLLKWVSDKPDSTFSVLQENRRRPREKIPNAFAYGENPYAWVMQDEGTLIGIHRVPEAYGFGTLRAPFTRQGAILHRIERGGWIFCHGGRVLFAFRTLVPGTWEKPDQNEQLDLYRSEDRCNGWILETAPPARYPGADEVGQLEAFARAVTQDTQIDSDLSADPPWISFRNLDGHTLRLRAGLPGKPDPLARCRDGNPAAAELRPILSTQSVDQQPNGPLTLLLDNGHRRVYDFSSWTIKTHE